MTERRHWEASVSEPARLVDTDFFHCARTIAEEMQARGVLLSTYDVLALANRLVNVEGFARRPF